jgi:hypothetical protein
MTWPEGYQRVRTRNPGCNQFIEWLESNHPALLVHFNEGETPMKSIGDVAEAVGFRRPTHSEKVGDYLNALRPYVEDYAKKT